MFKTLGPSVKLTQCRNPPFYKVLQNVIIETLELLHRINIRSNYCFFAYKVSTKGRGGHPSRGGSAYCFIIGEGPRVECCKKERRGRRTSNLGYA